ncbi:MAG: DUF4382 domain-containing protein [Nitrospirae bacterium]|nr:DUF4382 domain-containing protein [Nitrospirota bacterium]
MKTLKNISSISFIFIGLSLILTGILSGCGSSASVSEGSARTGKVAILLTDGPTDEFSEVNVTVNEVSLLSDDGGPVVLFNGERRVNLLALQEVQDLFTITEDVPAGIYSKIRLRVSEPEFVKKDGQVVTTSQIHLVANGKIDLVPDQPIEVIPGEAMVVSLDCDAEKSIFIHVSNPNSPVYQFRPVVFVNIVHDYDTRLVSVRGKIASIDPVTHSFLLLRTHPIFNLSKIGMAADQYEDGLMNENSLARRYLVRVDVTDMTRIFDEGGQPGDFDSLEVGQGVHVRGLLSFEDDLHLKAGLIEIGQYIRLSGEITSGIDEGGRFGFRPDPGLGVIGELQVQVYNETLIFEAVTRQRLNAEDLVMGKRVLVEGVLDLGTEPDLLHAALIIVKPQEFILTHLKGNLFDPDPESRTFQLSQDCPGYLDCPAVLLPVHVMSDAVILRISTELDTYVGIEQVPFEALQNGDKVDVFGKYDPSGSPFHATVVLVN